MYSCEYQFPNMGERKNPISISDDWAIRKTMNLYHYTCLRHLMQIYKDQEIRLTASNLLVPISMDPFTLEDPLTDNIKPVVWLSDSLDFKNAEKNGLPYIKTEVAIVIPNVPPLKVYKWDKWAKTNGINKEWFQALKDTAPNWRHFYVSESPIPFTDKTEFVLRPDIEEYYQ